MSRNKIILASIFLIVMAGVFVVPHNKKTPEGLFPTPLTTPDGTTPQKQAAQDPRSEIVYTADGKLDTSRWQEYRSDYGGFSVRAPKRERGQFEQSPNVSLIENEFFNYFIFRIDASAGLLGLSIRTIKKTNNSTLNTWLDAYVVPSSDGKDKILNVQNTTVGGYPALQFDIQRQVRSQHSSTDGKGLVIVATSFPSGTAAGDYLGSFISNILRYVVIDLGNRYVLISYTLPPTNREAISAYFRASGYWHPEEPAILDDKTLSDVYVAILDSFQAFTPTKS